MWHMGSRGSLLVWQLYGKVIVDCVMMGRCLRQRQVFYSHHETYTCFVSPLATVGSTPSKKKFKNECIYTKLLLALSQQLSLLWIKVIDPNITRSDALGINVAQNHTCTASQAFQKIAIFRISYSGNFAITLTSSTYSDFDVPLRHPNLLLLNISMMKAFHRSSLDEKSLTALISWSPTPSI